jgi:hypothetical protein
MFLSSRFASQSLLQSGNQKGRREKRVRSPKKSQSMTKISTGYNAVIFHDLLAFANFAMEVMETERKKD